MKRLGGLILGTAIGMVALALPASALGISLGGSLLHLEDCRSVALARAANYDFEFSSNTTGPVPVHVAGVVDGSLTLCWSLDVKALSSVNVVTDTWVTAQGVLNGILTGTDASKVCTALRLTLGSGVTGKVTATSHANVAVDGAPPAVWDHTFAKDISVSPQGEDIVFKGCADTSGNVTTA